MHTWRHWVSIFLGLLVTPLGLIPLLEDAGVISWGAFLSDPIVKAAAYILVVGGFWLMIDTIHMFTFHAGAGLISLVIGFAVLGIGTVQVLSEMGKIGFSLGFIEPLYLYFITFTGITLVIIGMLPD